MGLLDAYEAGPPIRDKHCAVCVLRGELKKKRKDADLKGLEALISAVVANRNAGINPKEGWNAHTVTKVLNEEGYKMTRRMLEVHLHNECGNRD
jgi:hypothetical protein